ncbi:DoxX family membrane protein [Lysinibacillus yapensis]|uniref:DoxX family membrane protein n=1 Tax=Ureibacillus yapensis TaxID=2304605 RepID=A0A396SB67_9BACL|nr:DoxX family membrane protein [Lysinibacillus yapensis]RHW36713.1 DoxX family membrane protein [Lysinibacillus yapensis]
MLLNWWRNHRIAASILVILRIYLGFGFLVAGWGKLTSGQFDARGFIANAIKNPVTGSDGNRVYGIYTTFLETIALPNVHIINVLVPWGEVLVGLGLLLGCLTSAAAFFGMLMNFSYLMAGAISQNPIYILAGFLILTAGANAGKFGLDFYILPLLKELAFKRKNRSINNKIEKKANLI